MTLSDEDGNVIDTFDELQTTCLNSGETGGDAFRLIQIKEEPDKVELDFAFDLFDGSSFKATDVTRMDIVNTKINRQGEGNYSIVGDAVCKAEADMEFGEVSIIFKNYNDEIIGGEEIYISDIIKGKNSFSKDYLDAQIVTDNYVCYGTAEDLI